MFIFYHEYHSTSTGAAVVIMNLIRGLAEEGEIITLINYHDSELHKALAHIPAGQLSVIDGTEKNIKAFAKTVAPTDIIMTTHFYSVLRHFRVTNPKFLFYCINI